MSKGDAAASPFLLKRTQLCDIIISTNKSHKCNVLYAKDGDNHFTAVVHVAVSNQFFGWLCDLGNKVKILSPSPRVEEFKEYLDNMRKLYE